MQHIEKKEHDQAVEIYRSLGQEFKTLEPPLKKTLYKDLVDLAHHIDASNIHKKIDAADKHLAVGKKAEAASLERTNKRTKTIEEPAEGRH